METQAAAPDFWNDQERAQKILQQRARLERALNRAARLASESLRFGKAEEAAPVLARLNLGEAANEAIEDALAPFGVKHLDMPVKPESVWKIMNS